jgi:hypothetical protein
MSDKQEPNPGHFHEIADRCHIINCLIDDHIIGHPGMTGQMTTWAEKAQEFISRIMEAAWDEKERMFPAETPAEANAKWKDLGIIK